MVIRDLLEKDIHDSLHKKLKPKIFGKRAKHKKGHILKDGKKITVVKIPNNHNRVIHNSKTKYIALALFLNEEEFESLIDCPLTGPQYFDLINNRI